MHSSSKLNLILLSAERSVINLAIARFITAKEIMEIFNEHNPTNRIGYTTALEWKNQMKKEHEDVLLPNKNVIPYQWLEERFGTDVYKRKDA